MPISVIAQQWCRSLCLVRDHNVITTEKKQLRIKPKALEQIPNLDRSAEQEEGQVEQGEAGQQVLLLGHGASVLLVLAVHHHHVDHQPHHRQAEHHAEQEGALPPAEK